MEVKRFIEEEFPIEAVSKESAKEKNIRRGQISTLHIWWARRPLGASRATNYASLIPAPRDQAERRRTERFIADLSKWDNMENYNMLGIAKKDILKANGGIPPKILDPFSGGGAIPLEALRLGCETYASDYNPVSTLILKCTLEYPQRFGHSPRKEAHGLVSPKSPNTLTKDVAQWGEWIFKKVEKEMLRFYETDRDGSIPTTYLWARTIPCQNPTCGAEIPLIMQFWLANTQRKKISLFPEVSNGAINFRIVGTGHDEMPRGFDPEKGSVSRAVATCFVCHSAVDGVTTRSLFSKGKSGNRMLAVVLRRGGEVGKTYRVATDRDSELFGEATEYLQKKRKALQDEWGVDPVPDEPTPEGKGSGAERAFSVQSYGMKEWGQLFNARQKLVLLSLSEAVRQAYPEMIQSGYAEDLATAVTTYLAFLVDKIASSSNTLSRWQSSRECVADTFSRGALPIVWDYPETNIFGGASRSYHGLFDDILLLIDRLSNIETSASVSQGSATSLPYPDSFFDAVITDPPYYDNVPYSYLSDFFYVWLKRTVGSLYPDLFPTPLTPKKDEIVAYSNMEGGLEKGKQFFKEMLGKSFSEIHRVLKPNGVSVIVFAHKSTAGWETLINSLQGSGMVVTGAWPIHTEMPGRLRASGSAALASSIYMVARKSTKISTGFYSEVRDDIKKHLEGKLDRLWGEKIVGADFLISAIGASIEVFGKYEKIIDDEGNQIQAPKLLEDVRRTVTDYAVRKVLHNGFSVEITQMTRFYILWRWAYGELEVSFDDAHKLAQSVGIDLSKEWNRGFIKKDKESIVVQGPEARDLSTISISKELIDILHCSVMLWRKGKLNELSGLLKESGFGNSDTFYRVAQAIAETLPSISTERKLLEGFMNSRERLREELREETVQKRLFE
jgi:adenine-specific DNA methylase